MGVPRGAAAARSRTGSVSASLSASGGTGSRSQDHGTSNYWLGGRRTVLAALRSGRARRLALAEGNRGSESLQELAARRGVATERLTREELTRRAGEDAQGCAALVPALVPTPLDAILDRAAADAHGVGAVHLIVACDHLQDPRNLGAVARTLEAAGGAGLIFPTNRSVGLTLAAERTAAGAFESLPWAQVHNLPQALMRCRQAGFWVFGAAPDGMPGLQGVDWAPRSVLVVGAEDRGLSPLVRRHCDRLVSLPMRGRVESLNASVAAAILLYDWVRWDAGRREHAH